MIVPWCYDRAHGDPGNHRAGTPEHLFPVPLLDRQDNRRGKPPGRVGQVHALDRRIGRVDRRAPVGKELGGRRSPREMAPRPVCALRPGIRRISGHDVFPSVCAAGFFRYRRLPGPGGAKGGAAPLLQDSDRRRQAALVPGGRHQGPPGHGRDHRPAAVPLRQRRRHPVHRSGSAQRPRCPTRSGSTKHSAKYIRPAAARSAKGGYRQGCS